MRENNIKTVESNGGREINFLPRYNLSSIIIYVSLFLTSFILFAILYHIKNSMHHEDMIIVVFIHVLLWIFSIVCGHYFTKAMFQIRGEKSIVITNDTLFIRYKLFGMEIQYWPALKTSITPAGHLYLKQDSKTDSVTVCIDEIRKNYITDLNLSSSEGARIMEFLKSDYTVNA